MDIHKDWIWKEWVKEIISWLLITINWKKKTWEMNWNIYTGSIKYKERMREYMHKNWVLEEYADMLRLVCGGGSVWVTLIINGKANRKWLDKHTYTYKSSERLCNSSIIFDWIVIRTIKNVSSGKLMMSFSHLKY